MNIQIFGTKKCNNTKKAQRFFKERGIKFQFVDLAEKGLSKGELNSVARSIPLKELWDPNSKECKKQRFFWLEDAEDIAEKLLLFPLLFKTPIVRNGQTATVGDAPSVWKSWQATS